MTEKQQILAQLREDLGVTQVNYLDDDIVEFGYKGYYIHIQVKKAQVVREKPDLKTELRKISKKKPIKF